MMVKRKILVFIFCSLVLQFLSSSVPVYAFQLELTYPKLPTITETPEVCINLPSEQKLPCFVKYVYHLALTISGIIAVSALIVGGVLYLISGDSVTKQKTARETMFGSFLGITLIFASFLILNVLNPQLLIFSQQRTMPKCTVLDDCPKGMICSDGICITNPNPDPFPKIEEEILAYVEVPLGWLIERVKTRLEILDIQANAVNDLVAEEDVPGVASIQELSKCLKELAKECDCSDLEIQCVLDEENDKCIGEIIFGEDPCDKTIDTNFCQDFDILAVNSNLRTTMKDIALKIQNASSKINEEKEKLKIAKLDLGEEKQKLALAEFLMNNSRSSPMARYDIANIEMEEKTLDVWEDPSPDILLDIPQKKNDDPATFYVLEQENKDLIELVKSVVFESNNLPLPPDWQPPTPPPAPADPLAVILDIPAFSQMGSWASEKINDCNDMLGIKSPPCYATTGCGCGPTSLAMILSYLLDPDVEPDDVALNLTTNEYVCGQGSYAYGLAQWANTNYNISFESLGSLKDLGLDKLQEKIRSGKPVMAACSHFGRGYGIDWGHISVIRGVEEGFVYFQDSVSGKLVFSQDIVKNYFSCYALFSFWKQ